MSSNDTRTTNDSSFAVAAVLAVAALTGCSSDSSSDDSSTTTADTTTTDTSDCEEFDATFAQVSDLVTFSCDDGYLYITSETGLPPTVSPADEERIMVGLTSWIQRVPIPYKYEWSVPRNPSWSNVSTEASAKGPIAVAVDGVPIFHYERRPDVSTALSNYTTENDTVVAGELDQCGGHAGQGDDYHYHYAPICLLDDHDLTQPIAFGLDGAPVYFGQAGSDYYGRGRFTDWDNFPAGVTAASLDDCNALMQSDGSYVHYTTKTPPYLIGCHHAPFDTALQIEPQPMTGRDQGTDTPLGGQYGEPITTLITDFSDDGNGTYTLTFDALDGSDQSSLLIYSIDSISETETCWNFEFRQDANAAGVIETACRSDVTNDVATNPVFFEHPHEH